MKFTDMEIRSMAMSQHVLFPISKGFAADILDTEIKYPMRLIMVYHLGLRRRNEIYNLAV